MLNIKDEKKKRKPVGMKREEKEREREDFNYLFRISKSLAFPMGNLG